MTDNNPVTRVLQSSLTFDQKMNSLLSLESKIAEDYNKGVSSVKPIHLMTPNDLVD